MKATNGSVTQLALGSGSTKRLNSNQMAVSADLRGRVVDFRALDSLRNYAIDTSRVDSELDYLFHLTNAQGETFARSKGYYSDCVAQLDNFKSEERSSFLWNVHARRAVERVKGFYSGSHLSMLQYHTLSELEDAVTDWDTSMGWTGILTGKTKKYMYLGDELLPQLLVKEQEARRTGSFSTPIVCWYRTQGSGAYTKDPVNPWGKRTGTWKSKKRLVFMVDGFVVMSESRFGKPLTDRMRTLPGTGIGKDDQWFYDWVMSKRRKGWNFISLDYSKYDSTIPSWLIHAAFDVIRSMFDDYDARLLEVIEHDFIHKDVFGGRGREHFDHGNPSGSRLTTIVNCICNQIITETWADKFGIRVEYNVMGDDNLIYTPESVDSSVVASISQYIEHNFGIKCNVDKECFGSSDEDPKYLSRYWGYRGAYRPIGELISMIVFPEKSREKAYSEGVLTPELILYSYILAYPGCMDQWIRVANVTYAAKQRIAGIKPTKWLREELPYNVRLKVESSAEYSAYKRLRTAKLKDLISPK